MRLYVVLVVLAFAAGHARADEAADGSIETGGKHYLALGMEAVTLSTPAMTPDAVHPTTIEGGVRIGALPLYVDAAVGAAPSGYVDTHAGIDLRAGTVVKGIFGVAAGYQHEARAVDAMYSVEGPYVAPRIGVEVGTQKLWVRGWFDWRYTLEKGPSGHAVSVALAAGHDF